MELDNGGLLIGFILGLICIGIFNKILIPLIMFLERVIF